MILMISNLNFLAIDISPASSNFDLLKISYVILMEKHIKLFYLILFYLFIVSLLNLS